MGDWSGPTAERVRLHPGLEEFLEQREESMGDHPSLDPFSDDTPLEASCDLENPETCESCQ